MKGTAIRPLPGRRSMGGATSARPARLVTCALALAVLPLLAAGSSTPPDPRAPLGVAPPTLHETGLFVAPNAQAIDPAHLGFAPQYALWTDGATKRRWISLPPGEPIDATDPDAWEFPVGTRFWKEFSFDGRAVETRFMLRRADGSWLFATYAWDKAGTSATLVPPRGIGRAYEHGDGTAHAIPSQGECGACHLSGRSPVLGFSALQLSDDRDPNALHTEPAPPPGLTLRMLVQRGLVTGLGRSLTLAPPSISGASPTQRAALGYLHGNCGHCHNAYGPLGRLGLFLRQPVDAKRSDVLTSAFNRPLAKPPADLHPGTRFRIARGDAALSAIPQRMAARTRALQMPPIGTARVDRDAVDLINRWITETRIPRPSARPEVSNRR